MTTSLAMRDSESMDARERLRVIIETKALIRSDEPSFVLASGERSNFYFDMKPVLLDPEGLSLIADLMRDIVDASDAEYVGGLEAGAISIVAAVCLESYRRRPLPGFFVRREPKGRGTQKIVEGNLSPGSRVLLVDDVTTTGGSVLRAVDAVTELGCSVKQVVTIVDRLEGAKENLKAKGIELISLFTRDHFGL